MGIPTQFVMPAPVPESVLKKRKTQEKLASDKAAAAVAAKKANKDKRVQAYKSAEKYVKEYRALPSNVCACTARPRPPATTLLMARPSSHLLSASVVSTTCTPRPRRSCRSCACVK